MTIRELMKTLEDMVDSGVLDYDADIAVESCGLYWIEPYNIIGDSILVFALEERVVPFATGAI